MANTLRTLIPCDRLLFAQLNDCLAKTTSLLLDIFRHPAFKHYMTISSVLDIRRVQSCSVTAKNKECETKSRKVHFLHGSFGGLGKSLLCRGSAAKLMAKAVKESREAAKDSPAVVACSSRNVLMGTRSPIEL